MHISLLLSLFFTTLFFVGCNASNSQETAKQEIQQEEPQITQSEVTTQSLSSIAKKSSTKEVFVSESIETLTPLLARSLHSETISEEAITQALHNEEAIVDELKNNSVVTTTLTSYYAVQKTTTESSLLQTLLDKITSFITSLIKKLFFTSEGPSNEDDNVTATEDEENIEQENEEESTQENNVTIVEGNTEGEQNSSLEFCNVVEIVAESLNVRTTPNTTNEAIGVVTKGEKYVVVATEGNWANIWYDDEQTRWIYAPTYTKSIDAPCAKVFNTAALNIRSGASSSFDILGTVEKDSLWVYVDYDSSLEGTWKNIWFEGKKSWAHGNYLALQQKNTLEEETINVLVNRFSINDDANTSTSEFVTLFVTSNVDISAYQVSEKEALDDASWHESQTQGGNLQTIEHTLSSAAGMKTLYFRVKDSTGRLSEIVSATIELVEVVNETNTSLRQINRDAFYAAFRLEFGALNTTQVTGLNYLLENFEKDTEAAYKNLSVWSNQIAYLLATIKHEVANTYTPITEYGEQYCYNYDGGCTYKGRGYVQLTHKYNYEAMSPITGVDLVASPEKALEPNIAYTVMSYGSFYGVFTSRRLGDYIKEGLTDYYNARRVINGVDKASLIKGYAEKFEAILSDSAS